MSSKMKTPKALSVERQMLQRAIRAVQICSQDQAIHAGAVEKNERLMLAESKVQAEIDAIKQRESAEIVAWVESGRVGPEPVPNVKERKAAERKLWLAHGEVQSAQRHRIQLDELSPRLVADGKQAGADMVAAKLHVFSEIAHEQLGPMFRQAAEKSVALEATLLACSKFLADKQDAADPRTNGLFSGVIAFTKGELNIAAIRANATAAWASLWQRLDSDPAAELEL